MISEQVPYLTEADVEPTELGGITGWIARVVDALGELGVGLLVALETVAPPVPSEVVLAMAGEDRRRRWLDRLPLVDTGERASARRRRRACPS